MHRSGNRPIRYRALGTLHLTPTLQISHICEQSCYVHTGLLIVRASTFEIFTSSAEESNSKLLPPNAFPGLTVLQKCVDDRAVLPWSLLK